MTDRELYQQLAEQTGESTAELRRHGFRLWTAHEATRPSHRSGRTVDWDRLARERNVQLGPVRGRRHATCSDKEALACP